MCPFTARSQWSRTLNDHNHFYAYSTAGDQVSWHSPESLEEALNRLSDFMSRITRKLLLEDLSPHPSDGLQKAIETLQKLNVPIDEVIFGETPLENLHNYGRWLHEHFAINQILLHTTKDTLSEARQLIRA